MTKLFMFEKPLGMRDTFPSVYLKKNKLKRSIERVVESYGYEFLETPALEYFETVGEVSTVPEEQMFKLLDTEGHTLVLRPDMTAPIARVAASKLLKEKIPRRLAYSANVYRAQQREGGRPAEFEQLGIEYIGDQTISADAEVISLLNQALEQAGVKNFTVAIGHIGFVKELVREIVGTEERCEHILHYLYEHNFVGFEEHVESLSISTIDKKRLSKLLTFKGTADELSQQVDELKGQTGEEELQDLLSLYQILLAYGYSENITFDLGLVSHVSYYTGILFEVYVDGIGFPVGSGGRYNQLLQKFGKNASATGFGIRLDYLVEATEELEKESSVLVLFSQERLGEAATLAYEKRMKGQCVTLQDIKGVTDIDAYSETFDEVIPLIGHVRREK
ncbi:ATP phosphoribosyltransferase [Bacillus coahuilensis p1.1.43]|uniref:ATP phosphoribosyltransferase regulatory subunit n=1 Tax=Bacillus coahuilensis p1.1.43 TaxID=1150625 RepID=A0A147K5V9_9BACI|nr:ATP phosphoribosyltransferase regulatory subunit [Bacillus coahuilensis]KUP05209.1 ATP phosphoribosyltransferase [Bacillus coahuilensis p1.1.43]